MRISILKRGGVISFGVVVALLMGLRGACASAAMVTSEDSDGEEAIAPFAAMDIDVPLEEKAAGFIAALVERQGGDPSLQDQIEWRLGLFSAEHKGPMLAKLYSFGVLACCESPQEILSIMELLQRYPQADRFAILDGLNELEAFAKCESAVDVNLVLRGLYKQWSQNRLEILGALQTYDVFRFCESAFHIDRIFSLIPLDKGAELRSHLEACARDGRLGAAHDLHGMIDVLTALRPPRQEVARAPYENRWE